jgi:hypothetical protein
LGARGESDGEQKKSENKFHAKHLVANGPRKV